MGVSFGFTRLFQQCDKVGPYWVSVMVVFCIGKTHLPPHWFQFDIRKEENRKMVYTWTFHRAAVRSRLKFIFATNEMKRSLVFISDYFTFKKTDPFRYLVYKF